MDSASVLILADLSSRAPVLQSTKLQMQTTSNLGKK